MINKRSYSLILTFVVSVLFILLISFLSCKTTNLEENSNLLGVQRTVDKSIFDKIDKPKYEMDSQYVKDIITTMSAHEHVFGSKEQENIKNFIVQQIEKQGSKADIMEFSYTTPIFGSPFKKEIKKGFNIITKPLLKNKKDCTILVGSHYDSKKISPGKCLGANDGGSSSALLLDFLRYMNQELKNLEVECSVSFVWLDGEESVLKGWFDWENYYGLEQDNTYGSRFLVQSLTECNKPYSKFCMKNREGVAGFVLFDMIGSSNIKLTNDVNSDEGFKSLFKNIWFFYHSEQIYNTPLAYVEDDHIPFVNKGISKVIDIIDLYHTGYWHNDKDTVENVSIPSIKKVSIVGIDFILNLALGNNKD